MAGNIIPAIATTNAVIAGLIVLQALQVLRSKASSSASIEWPLASRKKRDGLRTNCLGVGKPQVPLGTVYLAPPNETCSVCRDVYATVPCDPTRVTLGEIVGAVKRRDEAGEGEERAVIVFEGTRMLSDPDFDDNLGQSLENVGCTRGKFLTIQDEDGVYENVVLALCALP